MAYLKRKQQIAQSSKNKLYSKQYQCMYNKSIFAHKMDLFGDLPPPGGSTIKGDTSGVSLFGDLPPESQSSAVSGVKRSANSGEDCSAESVEQKKRKETRFHFKVFTGERKGEREDMQDAHQHVSDMLKEFKEEQPESISRMSYFAVFDGHSGARASAYAAEHLHQNIVSKFPRGGVQNIDREVRKCLIDAFKVTDNNFLLNASNASPSWKDGTTAVAILVLDDVIYVANLGDSKAVLCRESDSGKLSAVKLTKDHSPVDFEERSRIQKAGGFVRDGRVSGVLEVSRSIGDGKFKHCGVTCLPDVKKCTLLSEDRFILVACDGLWKAFDAEEALLFVQKIIKDETIVPPKDVKVESNFRTVVTGDPFAFRCEAACQRLAIEAVTRGCADNVTVMIIIIQQTP